MTVEELITELQKMPQGKEVLVAGEKAQKVLLENCCGNEYVHIFEGVNIGETVGRF